MKLKPNRFLAGALAALMLASPLHLLLPSAEATSTSDYDRLLRLCAEPSAVVDTITFRVGSPWMTLTTCAGEEDSALIDPQQPQAGTTPLVHNNRTLLPVRALAESLGAEVRYANNNIFISAGSTTIQMTGNQPSMQVNGETVPLDVPVMYARNRSFAPVRAIAESLNCEVDYDAPTQTITISQPCVSCRLLVQTDRTLPDTHPVDTLRMGGLRVLVYDSMEETRKALDLLTACGIEAAPDQMIDLSLDALPGSVPPGWHDETTQLPAFSQKMAGDRPVKVAVIDSGVDASLPLFRGRIASGGRSFLPFNANTGDTRDELGHGTATTGLIAQNTPANVKLLPLKLFGRTGTCLNLSVVVSAVYYAVDQNCDLINMSLSSLRYAPIEEAVEDAVEAGTAVVCSAGNQDRDTMFYSPAACEAAIVVGGSDQQDGPARFSSLMGSNYGSSVDLSAPAVQIRALSPGGKTQTVDGTSFSAPLVTAAGAVLLTRQDYAPASLERALCGLTRPFRSSNGHPYGSGILDLSGALPSEPQPQPTPEPTPKPVQPEQPHIIGYEWDPASEITCYLYDPNLRTHRFTLLAHYSDGSFRSVTEEAELTVQDPSILSIRVQRGTVEITPGAVGETYLVPHVAAPDGVAAPIPLRVHVALLPPHISADSLTLSPRNLEVYRYGQTPASFRPTVYIDGTSYTDAPVQYTVSDPSILRMEGNEIVPLRQGIAKVTAEAGGRRTHSMVYISDTPLEKEPFRIEAVNSREEHSSNSHHLYHTLKITTPIPHREGGRDLTLWLGIMNDGTRHWEQARAFYFPGGSDTITIDLDLNALAITYGSGIRTCAYSLFYSEDFASGGTLVDHLFQMELPQR